MRILLCTSLIALSIISFSRKAYSQSNTSNKQSASGKKFASNKQSTSNKQSASGKKSNSKKESVSSVASKTQSNSDELSNYNDNPLNELMNEAEQKEIENANQTIIPASQPSLKAFVEQAIPKKTPNNKLKIGIKVFLGNLEDAKDVKTVYSKPGFDWVSCTRKLDVETGKDYCEEATGWPNQDAEMEIIGRPETRVVTDPFTGELTEEVYHQIKFNYSTTTKDGLVINKSGTGYLAESFLTTQKYKPVYGVSLKDLQDEISNESIKDLKSSDEKDSNPNPNSNTTKNKDRKKLIETENIENPESAIVFKDLKGNFCEDRKAKVLKIAPEVQIIKKIIVKEKVDFLVQTNTIYDSIGQCVTKPATKALTRFPKGNIFDSLVLSDIKTSHKLKMTGEDDKPITTDDLISIDAMARTLYGEMGQCFNKGMQYPMSVARIIVNRSENETYRSLFIKGEHNEDKPDIAKVATTPSQFNNWMKKNKSSTNGPLHHSLCPPKKVNEPFWNGNKASNSDVEVWRNAVRIATEAVVYPKRFKERTKDLKDVYFYTSGMGKFYNSKLIKNKEIGDRPIDNTRCIELWTFPTASIKSAKTNNRDKKRIPASKKKKSKKK